MQRDGSHGYRGRGKRCDGRSALGSGTSAVGEAQEQAKGSRGAAGGRGKKYNVDGDGDGDTPTQLTNTTRGHRRHDTDARRGRQRRDPPASKEAILVNAAADGGARRGLEKRARRDS